MSNKLPRDPYHPIVNIIFFVGLFCIFLGMIGVLIASLIWGAPIEARWWK